jgi:hypothetical protein
MLEYIFVSVVIVTLVGYFLIGYLRYLERRKKNLRRVAVATANPVVI